MKTKNVVFFKICIKQNEYRKEGGVGPGYDFSFQNEQTEIPWYDN